MEEHKTDKTLLVKGLKNMAISLVFMFLGPTILYMAFSNKEKPLFIPILIFGIIASFTAIYSAYKGLRTIMDSIFKREN